jgi:hypothetical protein
LRPGVSDASWAFRWLQQLPNVKMILSGMSDLDQMKDNVKTFEERQPLSEQEAQTLMKIAEELKNSVPCTACRYCCEGCPKQLDIPKLLSLYNDLRFAESFNIGMTIDGMKEEARPSACIGCGRCAKTCPQKINVPQAMKEFTERLAKMPSWAELCRIREEEAKKLKAEK